MSGLTGHHVQLEPLSYDHRTDLTKVALDAELWRWTPTQIHSRAMLRHHMILPDGRVIEWVYDSLLRDEWPLVRGGLQKKLAQHAR